MRLIKNPILKYALIIFLLLIGLFFCIRVAKFRIPLSTVVYAKDGSLLGARIARDGQYRFPPSDSLPTKYQSALIAYEDRYFFIHPGINLFSMAKAMKRNVIHKKIVSGGSTITMQVIRAYRNGKARTIKEKMVEVAMALRLEVAKSKYEILRMYASNVPFGGNVVGLEAACWRYFGRNAQTLSWAEASLLAVLPNAPSLLHPGKNREALLIKRNSLLLTLHKRGLMDDTNLMLALEEPLPDKPFQLPNGAPHLLSRIGKGEGKGITATTIDFWLQQRLNRILEKHMADLRANYIFNAAILVLETQSGNVLTYIGNAEQYKNEIHGNDVDIIMAPRSTGSILKPFLFALMQQEGIILPNTLVADIPTYISGFNPQNFNHTFDGAVPASEALIRSLNVPAVRMLRNYGIEKFHHYLSKSGISTLTFSPDHYGLSLILGGAEANLWDLCGLYASWGRILSTYTNSNSKYNPSDLHAPRLFANETSPNQILSASGLSDRAFNISASAIWLAFQAMTEVNRPEEEWAWRQFSSSGKIAWKTGTSYGNRDGWAIGVTPAYTVGIWVGNASGEGRPGLTGTSAAAPILFDVFRSLPHSHWFTQPFDDMVRIPVCRESGYMPSIHCNEVDSIWVSTKGLETTSCPYHYTIHTNKAGSYRVNVGCVPASDMVQKQWFVLPPSMEWYYKSHAPNYQTLPPWKQGCHGGDQQTMEFIYPTERRVVYLPRDMNGKVGSMVAELANRNTQATIYWHLDDVFLGETKGIHKMEFSAKPGLHTLFVVDSDGNMLKKTFELADMK